MNALTRFTPFFVAAALPLLLFAWFLPAGEMQVDMLLLWMVAMVLVALPMLFLELALAVRSQAMPWQGMQKLTRESDSSLYWRSFAGLSVLLAMTMAAALLSIFAGRLVAMRGDLGVALNIPSYAVASILMIMALIISPLKHRLLAFGAALILLSAVLTLLLNPQLHLVVTATNLTEWAVVVVMALFSVGAGTGLFWFGDKFALAERQAGASLTAVALPIWLTQFIFGVLAFLSLAAPPAPWTTLMAGAGILLVAAFLIYYAASQLMARFGTLTGAVMTVVLALLLAVLPIGVAKVFLVILGLTSALILAIFSGWLMKISHLRKSLNFHSEGRYNLWRVAVRWLVPLAIVAALVGWLMLWLA